MTIVQYYEAFFHGDFNFILQNMDHLKTIAPYEAIWLEYSVLWGNAKKSNELFQQLLEKKSEIQDESLLLRLEISEAFLRQEDFSSTGKLFFFRTTMPNKSYEKLLEDLDTFDKKVKSLHKDGKYHPKLLAYLQQQLLSDRFLVTMVFDSDKTKKFDYMKEASALCKKYGLNLSYVRNMAHMAELYAMEKNIKNAKLYLQKVRHYLKNSNKLNLKSLFESYFLKIQGNIERSQGNLLDALKYLEESKEKLLIAIELDLHPEIIRIFEFGSLAVYTELGIVYNKLGKYNEALEHFMIYREIDTKLDQIEWPGWDINIGNIYRVKGELDKALEHFEKAQSKFLETPSIHRGIGVGYSSIADIKFLQNKLDEAIEYHKKGYDVYSKLNLFEDMSNSLHNQYLIFIRADKVADAELILKWHTELSSKQNEKVIKVTNEILQAYNLVRADRIKDRLQAQEILEKYSIDDTLDFEIRKDVMQHLIELLIEEVKAFNSDEAFDQAKDLVDSLLEFSQE